MTTPGPERGSGGCDILIVEDDTDCREALSLLLESSGYHVTAVRSGPDALARIAEEVPRLILLDIVMPRMSGEELVHHLRASAPLAPIPVVLVSGRRDVATVRERLGVEGFLRKPPSVRDLIATCERWTGKPAHG